MKFLFMLALTSVFSAHAYEAQVRKGQAAATLEAMIDKVNTETQLKFGVSDFMLIEERELATAKFQMFVQASQNIPVARTAIRIWSDKTSSELILAELHLDEQAYEQSALFAAKFRKAKFSSSALKSKQLQKVINQSVTSEVAKHSTDNRVLGMKFKDQWENGDLVRVAEVRGRRGIHSITISLLKNKVIENIYREFPQSAHVSHQSFKANVYPVYEEVELTGERLPFEQRDLKYINQKIPNGGDAPLADFENVEFSEEFYNPLLADTSLGQQAGYWSEGSMRRSVEESINKLPLQENTFSSGLLLQGKFATINLHPAVKDIPDVNINLKSSTNHIVSWFNPDGSWQAKPLSGHYGHAFSSETQLLSLFPSREADHNPSTYVNSGFDEVQVYYAVTVLMEALNEMGFEDAELSTKPFHAFLFDPDISMKDNAYYYDNTINFTTYNPKSPNLARDNPTIWHELGHGVMDRLMGPHLGFAGAKGGYGGLSEGMADFVAKIILEHQTSGANFPGKNDFRIINETGFYLTNEFHDEGEAYGGAMSDMLDEAISIDGRQGLYDFTDLTLEAMRLTRNHPALSPRGWFEHMLYADEIGSEVRLPGKFKSIILKALKTRNFGFNSDFVAADMQVTFGETELTNESQGSRENPITPCGVKGEARYDLKLSLTAGEAGFIKFPATVKVEFKKGALQGAIRWMGEESNPLEFQVNSEMDELSIPLAAMGKCEQINQPDGSCKDYAYLQVYNQGMAKPIAKKRFYLKIKEGQTCPDQTNQSK